MKGLCLFSLLSFLPPLDSDWFSPKTKAQDPNYIYLFQASKQHGLFVVLSSYHPSAPLLPPTTSTIPHHFDLMGAIDILLPGLVICHLLGQIYRYLEKQYITTTPGKVTYLSFVGFVARFSMWWYPSSPTLSYGLDGTGSSSPPPSTRSLPTSTTGTTRAATSRSSISPTI